MENKKFNFIFAILCVIGLQVIASIFTAPIIVRADVSDNFISNQVQITENDIISENSAYLLLKDNDEMRSMTYLQAGDVEKSDPNYNKLVYYAGLYGRQYEVANILSMKLDEGFATESENKFIVNIDYYDYGGAGSFYVEYMQKGQTTPVRLTVAKRGDGSGGTFEYQNGKWWRVSMLLEDADFTGKLTGGCDIRIHTGAWNAFSKVEVLNVSRYENASETFGVFNMSAASALNKLGVFDGFGTEEDFEPQLSKVLTREEALKLMITFQGRKSEAESKNLKPATKKVSEEYVCYAGLAQALGVIEPSEELDLREEFSQNELLVWYLKLMGIEDSDLWSNAYKLAEDLNWIAKENIIMQPQCKANVDALVVLAINTFTENNRKTGYNAFTAGYNSGKYTYETITSSDYPKLTEWLYTTPFKLPSTKCTDPYTGREYNTVNFFGKEATIPYFTQRCVAMDNKRIYFNTIDCNIWEYNIETEMCRHIAKCRDYGNFMITPLNNLFYMTGNEIRKINLDTYQDVFVADGIEGYSGWYHLLQINNDESLLSVEVIDANVPQSVRPKLSGRYLNILDLKTGEWDFSHHFVMPAGDPTFNHFCINPNPELKNWYFFAHENANKNSYVGGTTPQFDRNWMVNLDTDEYFNVFDQKWLLQPEKDDVGTGIISTGSCHESWTGNGEWFGTIIEPVNDAFGISTTFSDGVMALMKPDGSDLWFIRADFSKTKNYYFQNASVNHGSFDWDGNWMIADTAYNSQNETDFYLVETHTGDTHLLARFAHNGANNGHVHPQFSMDSSLVVFGGWTPGFKVAQWGWMDVSDITTKPSEGGRFDISDSCETFAYKGDFDHAVIPTFNNDGSVKEVKIPAGRQMYVDVKKTVVEEDNTPATITVTYKDNSTMPIKLCYYTWKENAPGDVNEFVEREITIKRSGTGKRITKTFKFDDICLGNMQTLRSDFRLRAAGGSAVIYSVDVSIPETK